MLLLDLKSLFLRLFVKNKVLKHKGSETTEMIQPTRGAIYFFSAPSLPLNCSSQSNQASVFNPNLISARERDKKSFMLI